MSDEPTSEWYLLDTSGEPIGPYTTTEVRDRLRNGQVELTDLALKAGGADWLPIERCEGLYRPQRPHAPARFFATGQRPPWEYLFGAFAFGVMVVLAVGSFRASLNRGPEAEQGIASAAPQGGGPAEVAKPAPEALQSATANEHEPPPVDYSTEAKREAWLKASCNRAGFCAPDETAEIASHTKSAAEKAKLETIRRSYNSKVRERMLRYVTTLRGLLRSGVERQRAGPSLFLTGECIRSMNETRKTTISPLYRELDGMHPPLPGKYDLAMAAMMIAGCWSCLEDQDSCEAGEQAIGRAVQEIKEDLGP